MQRAEEISERIYAKESDAGVSCEFLTGRILVTSLSLSTGHRAPQTSGDLFVKGFEPFFAGAEVRLTSAPVPFGPDFAPHTTMFWLTGTS